jgi:hypothetical protein
VRNYDVASRAATVCRPRVRDPRRRARHDGRPSYRVAADLANRFPLRYEVFSKGQLVFETHFAEIQYHPGDPGGTFEDASGPTG